MDHGQDGLRPVHVHFGVFHDFLIGRLHFTETVIANEVASILFWLALKSTKRLRHASSTQTANIRFFLAVLYKVRRVNGCSYLRNLAVKDLCQSFLFVDVIFLKNLQA